VSRAVDSRVEGGLKKGRAFGTKMARRPPAVEPKALRFCSSKA